MPRKRSKPTSEPRPAVPHTPEWLSSPELSADSIINVLPLWEAKAMEHLHNPTVSSGDRDFGAMTEALCMAAESRGIDSSPIHGFELFPDVASFRGAAKSLQRLETQAKNEVIARIRGGRRCRPAAARGKVPSTGRAGAGRPRLDEEHQRVYDGARWHDVTPEQLAMLSLLFKAKGGWVAGRLLSRRPDKLRKAMPPAVRRLVETHKANGYRIPSLLPQ